VCVVCAVCVVCVYIYVCVCARMCERGGRGFYFLLLFLTVGCVHDVRAVLCTRYPTTKVEVGCIGRGKGCKLQKASVNVININDPDQGAPSVLSRLFPSGSRRSRSRQPSATDVHLFEKRRRRLKCSKKVPPIDKVNKIGQQV